MNILDEEDADNTEALNIGDYVFLQNLDYQGNLSSEGIISEDVELNTNGKSIFNCLFCIHLQRQYSAHKELEDFLVLHKDDAPESSKDPSTEKYLHALQRGRNNEEHLNEKYMSNRAGTPVFFGDIIQLFHVQSEKYLTIYPSQLASEERENLKVMLSKSGNSMSWLSFIPRYKIDRIGDRVMNKHELFLSVSERVGEYVHVADKSPREGRFREVNCSLQQSSWTIYGYQSIHGLKDKSFLVASQILVMQDPETLTNVSLAIASQSVREDSEEDSADVTEAIARAHDLDRIYLKHQEEVLDSNSLWMIEKKNSMIGGPLKWKQKMFRIRHVNTGVYLRFDAPSEKDVDVPEDSQVLTFSEDFQSHNEIFHINQHHSLSPYLGAQKASQLQVHSMFLKRGPALSDREDGFCLIDTKDESAAINILFSGFTKEMQGPVDAKDPYDVYVGLSLLFYTTRYSEMTVMPHDDITSTVWPTADQSDADFFPHLMKKALIWVMGFPISVERVDANDRGNEVLIGRRQRLFREQGSLQKLLMMINILIPISEWTDITVKDSERREKTEEVLSLIAMGQKILTSCFEVVYYCIKNNAINQMYVADFMPVLLAHLGSQSFAAKCVTEMLNNNMELQETKIRKREISIFVEKLRRSQMNAMYLNLIQSCCSCMGDGVDDNQCSIAEMIFSDMKDVVIQMHPDYTKRQSVPWNVKTSIYITAKPVLGSPILGDHLISRGIPQLSLTWTTSTIQFSPLGLFGKLSVNVDEMFREHDSTGTSDDWLSKRNAGGGKKGKNAPNAATDFKRTIADYFLSQLRLFAEMCLDRNYVAVNTINEHFSYEALVAVLKLPVLDSLKAEVVNLIIHLHVDRDPQVEITIPCLTRIWSDISKSETPQFPFVEVQRRNYFGLLQEIISENIKNMTNKSWTAYSYQNCRLLLHLVKFNFYGSSERMTDLIFPLIRALDRRNVVRGKAYFKQSGSQDEEGVLTIEEEYEETLEDQLAKKYPTEKRVFEFLESTPFLIFILTLVMVAVGITLYMVIEDYNDYPGSTLYDVGLAISTVFIAEVSIRMFCYRRIKGELRSFCYQTFNMIDLIVCAVDIVFLCMPSPKETSKSNKNSGGKLVKTLRMIRLVRLVRIFRAAKVLVALSSSVEETLETWVLPSRYSKSPIHELKTMVQLFKVLSYAQKVIEDRNLSIFVRAFHDWDPDKSPSASEIFDQVITKCNEVTLECEDFNDILTDSLMYNDPELVQETLDIIVSQYSSRTVLLRNARNVQLLISNKRERQFKLVDQMLRQLESNAETQELWGQLTTEEDRVKSKQTHEILTELLHIIRSRRWILEFDEEYSPEKDIQDLLRNLGFFDIAFKVYDLLESISTGEDGNRDEAGENTFKIVTLCGTLMYWFLLDNPKNQEMAFRKLDFFVETLDDNIGSHRIIRATFRNNEYLMNKCPRDGITEAVSRICKNGYKPQYLSLLASITYVGDKNITKNQYDVIRNLTQPSKLPKVTKFLCPVDSEEYQRKKELMLPFVDARDINVDDLPDELAYHICLIEVLSGCTVGRFNITSIEAKVQSIFPYYDILQAILDPCTILIARCKLALHFHNAIVEVEMRVAGLERSQSMWDLLKTYPSIIAAAKLELQDIEKLTWESPKVSRQRIEYALTCMMIIEGFFHKYYVRGSMRLRESEEKDQVRMTLEEAENLIEALFLAVKDMHDMNSRLLSREHTNMIARTCIQLSKSVDLKNLVFAKAADDSQTKSLSNSERDIVTMETKTLAKYDKFLELFEKDDDVKSSTRLEMMGFVRSIQRLPFVADRVTSDVRYEPFIEKLVQHMKNQIRVMPEDKYLSHESTTATIWLLKAFRAMIEDSWQMDIYQRDEDGGAEQDEASEPIVIAFNKGGVTGLCIDMIAPGIHESVQLEAIRLAVAMLFKEGGALLVQESINAYMKTHDSNLFFKQIKVIITTLITWHNWNQVIILEDGESPNLPEEIIVIRFLQLLSEGHYLPNQEIMSAQPFNTSSTNLLIDLSLYMNTLSRIPCQTSTNAGIRVASTILEVLQGPCETNQLFFALNTDIMETINRLLRANVINDCVKEEEIELKCTVVDILQALLEGQGGKVAIYEKVMSVIHMDIIVFMALGDTDETEGMKIKKQEELGDEEIGLNGESLVLLKMLCDYKTSLPVELGIQEKLAEATENIASVEVMWNGLLQRRFFQKPSICEYLSQPSRSRLVEEVDRSNIENKLLDFVERSKELYREVRYQVYLESIGLSKIVNPLTLERATWFAFYIAFIINVLFISCYDSREWVHSVNGTSIVVIEPYLILNRNTNQIVTVINALNIILIVACVITLALFEMVKAPVIYEVMVEENEDKETPHWQIVFFSIVNPMAIYYLILLIVAILGLTVSHTWLPFYLLDIISKNSTAMNVLNSVVQPWKSLAMTLLIVVFVSFIYAFFTFILFHNDIRSDDHSNENYCSTLFSCFLFAFNYGLRMPGGIGDKMWFNLDTHWWLDFSWFMVVLVVIFNVVSGIIIMTFANLRDEKFKKDLDIHNRCFICGIEKDVFEKKAGGPEGFKDHIKREQNLWNYLYFIFFIWEQDKDDDDGLEYYVRHCVDKSDLIWFPINKAMCFGKDEDSTKKLIGELREDLKSVDQNLHSKVGFLKTEISSSVDAVIEAMLHVEMKGPSIPSTKGSRVVSSGAGGLVKSRTGTASPGLSSVD